MYCGSHRREAGFTLLEMIIAMTLLSILVTLLFASLKLAADSWQVGEAKIAQVNRKAVIYQFLKRNFAAIRPVPMLAVDGEAMENGMIVPVFQGYSMSLRFAAPMPLSAARKGLQIFDLIASGNDLLSLRVSLTPYYQSASQAQNSGQKEQTVILDNIRSISFKYYGVRSEMDAAQWNDSWGETELLPKLIKVTILLDDGSYWPDMVFPVLINAAPAPADNAAGNNGANNNTNGQ